MPSEEMTPYCKTRTGSSFPIDDKRSGSGRGVCGGPGFRQRIKIPCRDIGTLEGWTAEDLGSCLNETSQGAGTWTGTRETKLEN